jgi:pyruvate,orthophosphate dikinase
VKSVVVSTADELIKNAGVDMSYLVGTMIECPGSADGGRDCQGSRVLLLWHQRPDSDDLRLQPRRCRQASSPITTRRRSTNDPFARLDHHRRRQAGGHGRLSLATRPAPASRLGICGEHGGDPSSVEFCHNVGLSYVSCSPFRVPIARLAAAQAAVKAER